MIELYTVGATLRLNNLISPELIKIGQEFIKLQGMADALQARLNLIGDTAAGLSRVATQSARLGRNMNRAALDANNLQRQLLQVQAIRLPTYPASVFPGGRGTGGGAHGGRVHVGTHGVGITPMGFAAGDMAGPLIGAAVVGYGGYKAYESSKDLAQEQAKFAALGLQPAMNREAFEFARRLRAPGVSGIEAMSLFRDAQTVFRDSGTLADAEMVTPLLAKMMYAQKSLYGEEAAGENKSQFMDMLRVIELRRGLNSPTEFAKQANMIQQVLTTSGGRVDATQYLQMLKTGGVAAKMLSNEALYYQMEPLIQEMGGGRIGTGLMSAYNNLVQGKTTKRALGELLRLGLIDPKQVEMTKIGTVAQIKPGALAGTELLETSPYEWLNKVLLPALDKKGITKEEDILREIGAIFSNRTASQLFSTMYLQRGQIGKGQEMAQQAMNIDRAKQLADSTPAGAETQLGAAWTDLKVELGKNVLPGVVIVLHGLTDLLKGMDDFFASASGWKILKHIPVINTALALAGAAQRAVTGTEEWVTDGYGPDRTRNHWTGRYLAPEPPQMLRSAQRQGDVYLDGKKVGKVLSPYIERDTARAAMRGQTGFDIRASLPPAMIPGN